MHPSRNVHRPSGKTWQYNGHHVSTDLVQILIQCSPSYPGDFTPEGILISRAGVQQRPSYVHVPGGSEKELNWKFIPSRSQSFQAVLVLLNYRNVTKMWPSQNHILQHFWAHTSEWLWQQSVSCLCLKRAALAVQHLGAWDGETTHEIRPARQVRNHFASIAVCVCMNMYISNILCYDRI